MINHPPLWSPRFRYEAGLLQYKPFPRYPSWFTAWDVSSIEDDSAAALAAAAAAQSTATTALTAAGDANDLALVADSNASAAQSAADAAQTTANTGVTNAAAAQTTANTGVTNAAAALAAANAAAAAAAAITVDYASQHFIIPQSMHTITGGFGSAALNSLGALNVLYLMSGLNSEASFKVAVPAGNYSVTLVGERFNGGADCTLSVDGTVNAMNHFYNATAVHAYEVNYIVNSLTKGLHTFNLKITGRQPGNTTAYSLYLSYILVRPNP